MTLDTLELSDLSTSYSDDSVAIEAGRPSGEVVAPSLVMIGSFIVDIEYTGIVALPAGISLEAYLAELDAEADIAAGREIEFSNLDEAIAFLDSDEQVH